MVTYRQAWVPSGKKKPEDARGPKPEQEQLRVLPRDVFGVLRGERSWYGEINSQPFTFLPYLLISLQGWPWKIYDSLS